MLGIEQIIAETMLNIYGELFLGVVLTIFLLGLCFVMRMSIDGLAVVMLPIFSILFVFVPQLRLVFGLVAGIMLGIVFIKIIAR